MLRRWRIGDPAPSHLNSYQSKTQPYPGERHNQDGKYCHHKIADSVLYIPHLFSLPSKRSRGLPIAIHRQWPKQYQRNAVFRSAPLSRGETTVTGYTSAGILFQSTPLSRGETRLAIDQIPLQGISIHSPLTRGDDTVIPEILILLYFNPLPSHEGRPNKRLHRQGQEEFQSTPLSRGETATRKPALAEMQISIHSPLTRGDYGALVESIQVYRISIHSPLTRGDSQNPRIRERMRISIHSPLTRGDRKNRQLLISPSQIHYAIFTITSSTDLKLS